MNDDVRGGELTPEEMDVEVGEELPDREAMSLVNLNLAAPINAAAFPPYDLGDPHR